MKKKIILIAVFFIVGFVCTFGIRACIGGVQIEREKVAIERAEREAQLYPLTEKESDYWITVYAEAVRRGQWNPGEVANSAIIQLRKMQGGAE